MDSTTNTDWDGAVGFIRYINARSVDKESLDDGELQESPTGGSVEQLPGSSDSETDLEDKSVAKVAAKAVETTGKLEAVYREACRKLAIIPCSPFLRQIYDEEIDLSHYNLGPLGAKAVAKTMRENTTTALVNIHDNDIGGVGVKAFADMLAFNCFITILDLSINSLGKDGFEAFSDMLRNNKYIIELNLASTKLDNTASVFIGRAMEENAILRSLDLSSNEIGDEGAIHIAKGIKANKCILFLNLGCNHIRGKGATSVANALTSNASLRAIDLHCNGFADFGARAIGKALVVNHTLREIDISQNRITPEGAWAIGIGLEENTGLKVLKVGGNPFQSRGAKSIVDSLITNKETTLQELYFDDIIVSREFEKLLTELFEEQDGLYVQFGTVIQGKEHKRRGPQQKDLVSRILDYIELRGMRVLDFFRSMDKTGRLMITKLELTKGLKTAGIPMRRSQVDNLFDLLDVDGNGFAQYREFVDIIKKRTHEEFALTRNNYQWNH